MTGTELGLAVSVFLACMVEAVEALTIVLAVGTTRSWRAALYGCAAAIVVLGVVVAALGPALTSMPLNTLRLVIGGLLLVFGLQWLRKAVLRAAGRKALHDEEATFAAETEAARSAGSHTVHGIDGYAFAVSFKGVLLEGLEVAVIVLTFGANQHDVGLAAAAAGAAVAVVALAGVLARAPLARVPENTMKFAVGVDADLLRHVLGSGGRGRLVARWGLGPARADPRAADRLPGDGQVASPRAGADPASEAIGVSFLGRIAHGVWEFVVGDDWTLAAGVVVALGVTAAIAGGGAAAWWVMPIAVVVLLALSLLRAMR